MGKSDLTLGNEPLRFRNVSEGVLASGKPPGGLENDSFDIPEAVEPPGGPLGSGGIRFDTWERTVAFSQRFGRRFGVRKAPGRA